MNLDVRVPPWFAAQFAGVSRQLLNYWRTSGKITPGDDGLYRLGDVLEVEARTRRSPTSSRRPRKDWAALDVNSAGMPHAC